MAIEFRCSQCSQLLRVSEGAAGKSARCPKCQTLMTVPAASAAHVPAPPDSLPPAPTAPPTPSFVPPEPAPPKEPEPPLPPQRPGANPFAGQASASPFGPTANNINPYASPAAVATGPAYAPIAYARTGLPWETERRTIGCWFRTLGVILGSPTRAFSMMQQSDHVGAPLTYALYGIGLPLAALAAIALAIGILVLIGVAVVSEGKSEVVLGSLTIALFIAGIAAFYLSMYVVSFIVGNFVAAAIYHLALMLCSGARQGYLTTYRVTAFSAGSVVWIGFIPYVGALALVVWLIVLLIIGLSRAHEVPASKTALAILGFYACCCGSAVVLVLMLGILGALTDH